MHARDFFSQAQLRLQAAGCRYRIKQVPRSPFVQVYDTVPPRRQQAARGNRVDDEASCWELVEVLLQAAERAARGRGGLAWEELANRCPGDDPAAASLSWGELRSMVEGWIAPGGPKARDRNPFVCFRERGYFGRAFAADAMATTRQLEEFCLYTPESLLAHRADGRQQLIRRDYNSRGFYGVLQMVNYLAQRGVAIASPELRGRLERLKKEAGGLRTPAPRFIPRTEDLEQWLDQLVVMDPLRGEVEADGGVIEVGSFRSQGAASETKTGHRFALPLPAEWVSRYRLDEQPHSRRMLEELRRRHPVRTAEQADGTVQFFNNGALAIVLAHWLRNGGREDREIPVKLFGYHKPRRLPGQPRPRSRRERCRLYDLRHAWALRAKATTTWSTAVKASSMGHSEAVHASRYLVEEQAAHKLAHLLRRRDLDEGVVADRPVTAAPVREVQRLPEGVTPDLIELARKLKLAGVA